jgi:hypothetical protein
VSQLGIVHVGITTIDEVVESADLMGPVEEVLALLLTLIQLDLDLLEASSINELNSKSLPEVGDRSCQQLRLIGLIPFNMTTVLKGTRDMLYLVININLLLPEVDFGQTLESLQNLWGELALCECGEAALLLCVDMAVNSSHFATIMRGNRCGLKFVVQIGRWEAGGKNRGNRRW